MRKLQLAFRSLLHYKQYSIINILGLALSLACVIIIFRYVHGEMTVDRFNRNLDRIFVTTLETDRGWTMFSSAVNWNNQEDFSRIIHHAGVERYSQFMHDDNCEVEINDWRYDITLLAADTNFLKIMDFPIVSGVAELDNPHRALISEAFAQRVFGNENPIGETLLHRGQILTITGVIGETSTKSSITFDILASIELRRFWSGHTVPHSIVLLYPNVDYRTINHQHNYFFLNTSWFEPTETRYQLFPFSKLYLFPESPFARGNRQNINILILVGLLILAIGILNYINIHTVVMLRRGRELGMKKVFGASGGAIFSQLLLDNLLQILLAFLLAFIIVQMANPLVTNVLQLSQIPNIRFDIGLAATLLFALSFIATLYPFYRYHFATPIHSLRSIDKIRGGGSVRRIFLTFQYIITIAMIIVSLFFVKQLNFMMNFDLGFRTENLIQVQLMGRSPEGWNSEEEWRAWRTSQIRTQEEITHRLNTSPLFTHWSNNPAPHQRGSGYWLFSYGGSEYQIVSMLHASGQWLEMFDIQLIDGRIWDSEIDVWQQHRVIVTESVLPYFGITDWRTAWLQPQMRIWRLAGESPEEQERNPPYYIVGVVRNFTPSHLSQPSLPKVILFEEDSINEWGPVTLSYVPGRTQDAIQFLRTLHEETVGGEFSFIFIDDEMRAMYVEDRKVATIYSIFTLIAILISALGLFGMSFFDIQQRRREIAIRKVNGATVSDIINLLLRKYLISLGIAFVIAAPIAAYAINRYLEDFAHRAPVAWWLFAVALLVTAGISLLTLIYQVYRAANENPADVVKGG